MTTPTTPTSPTTMVARSPQDLLAVVPVVLGFVPRDSVVMLTFGARRAFHARVDLPPPDHTDEAVEALLEPATRHRVPRVVFVVYTDDATLGRRTGRALRRAFERAGIEVLEALRADGHRWYPLVGSRPGVPAWGVPYDVSTHPFAAQAVVDGRVTHASREELAASLTREPHRVRALAAAGSPEPGPFPAEAAWVGATVCRHVAAGTVPDDAEAARLLTALTDLSLRDEAWLLMERRTAPDHVAFWTDLVRRSPDDRLAAPAALLAFAAWLAGHGALSWCAVDACREVDPDYGLAEAVSRLLAHAVPPSEWGEPAAALDDPA